MENKDLEMVAIWDLERVPSLVQLPGRPFPLLISFSQS